MFTYMVLNVGIGTIIYYSNEELAAWATKIRDSGAKGVWVYFNNDYDAHSPKNAAASRRVLQRAQGFR